MGIRWVVRVTAPVVAISVLLLAVGVLAAWYVHRLQVDVSRDLVRNVSSMRAAEELEISLREARALLSLYLITRDRGQLDAIPRLKPEADFWLAEAERLAVTRPGRALLGEVRRGYTRFFDEFDQLVRDAGGDAPPAITAGFVRERFTVPVLQPAHDYLNSNEYEATQTSAQNQVIANRVALVLLLVGTCGSVAGLLTGYGLARGLSRSMVQLQVPIHDAAGKLQDVVGPVVLPTDVSFEGLHGGLRQMVEHIGTVVGRLQQSQREVLRGDQLAAVGQLAAGMAHELRNPLMAMKLLVQTTTERGAAAALAGRDLAVVEEEVLRLERCLQTFLDFARPPRPEKRPVAPLEVLEQTAHLLAGRADQKQVRLAWSRPARPLWVEADREQLRQVFLNLLLNALDAVPQGGVVDVRVASAGPPAGRPAGGDWVTVEVQDNGPGLPAALGDRIFEPFVSTKETGTGLGLSICRRLVEAHGGAIRARNRPEGGAALTVWLPLAAPGAGVDTNGKEGGRAEVTGGR